MHHAGIHLWWPDTAVGAAPGGDAGGRRPGLVRPSLVRPGPLVNPRAPMSEAGQITLQEAARRLGVHYMTAYRYVRTGSLPARQCGARWMVDKADVDAMRTPQPAGRPAAARRGSGPGRARKQLMSRLVAGDEAGAWTTLQSVLAGGADPAAVYVDLLAPVLQMIGDAWEANELQVAGEHRASAVATRLVGRLGPLFARRGRPRGTVVMGIAPGDRHGLPCAMLADVVRSDGFQVLDLGADTPVESFVESACDASRLVAVMIGATLTDMADSIATTVKALKGAGVTAPVLVGGAAVRTGEAAEGLGADAWTGRDARAALDVLNAVAAPRRRSARPIP